MLADSTQSHSPPTHTSHPLRPPQVLRDSHKVPPRLSQGTSVSAWRVWMKLWNVSIVLWRVRGSFPKAPIQFCFEIFSVNVFVCILVWLTFAFCLVFVLQPLFHYLMISFDQFWMHMCCWIKSAGFANCLLDRPRAFGIALSYFMVNDSFWDPFCFIPSDSIFKNGLSQLSALCRWAFQT